MATTTSFNLVYATDTHGSDKEKYTMANIIRNVTGYKHSNHNNVIVPVRRITNTSCSKTAASSRHPGQTHTPLDSALSHELAMARYLMHDLADHIFGHIVSTSLARDILLQFVEAGIVQVFKGTGRYDRNTLVDSKSDEVEIAVRQAFEDADRLDCIRPDDDENEDSEPEWTYTKTKGKEKQKGTMYAFGWPTFPKEPLRGDEVVSFLNNITDRAFEIAKPKLAVVNSTLRHRFAAPKYKHHAVQLSYESDREDMRPDFLLLPIEAFKDDYKTIDVKCVNFTASRLVGESKNRDLAAGVEQLHRYARGLKRAQPWVYYVLGMTITKDKAVLLRGEGSGTEHLDLMLTEGRGCIELIRILLGLALADKVDLGDNPNVVLGQKVQACKAHNVIRISKRQFEEDRMNSVPNPLPWKTSRWVIRPWTTSAALHTDADATLFSSRKRDHSAISDASEDSESTRSKRRKVESDTVEEVDRYVFYPVAVYGYECLGILFTASSTRGRGTTVFCVVNPKDGKKRLALRMAWQDMAHEAEQDAIMQRLKEQGSKIHPNVIVPLESFKVERNGATCTTLGAIRGFLEEQMGILNVENRALTVTVSELKRPVQYFWGVHDFVRGLRGALLGHEYLTKIGILHRDISENNIVLALRPGEERGYLIDFDMAILQDAEEPTKPVPIKPIDPFSLLTSQRHPHNKQPMKLPQIGTFPYISYNVLLGRKHTQFDDVESFLYVLFLFFFSYAGPLSKAELREADEAGFVQPIGSGRPSHMRNWPKEFADWAYEPPQKIGRLKNYAITRYTGFMAIFEDTESMDSLYNNWPQKLHPAITCLIDACFVIFRNSTLRGKESRTEISHSEFVSTLDRWLEMYSDLEDEFSNCPFNDESP